MIKLRNISKNYCDKNTDRQVLNNINIDINQGEFACIYGPSGCGKTTLLNIIGLMDTYSEGTYHLNDIKINNKEEKFFYKLRNEYFGYIFQDFNLIPDLNVLENVCVPMGYKGVSKKEREERAKYLLEEMGLSDKLKSYPSQLSGGEKQRVAIARAISNKPKFILADEPTGSLDQANGLNVMEILKKLNEDGTTIIMVTHDNNLSNYATRVIRLLDGSVVS